MAPRVVKDTLGKEGFRKVQLRMPGFDVFRARAGGRAMDGRIAHTNVAVASEQRDAGSTQTIGSTSNS